MGKLLQRWLSAIALVAAGLHAEAGTLAREDVQRLLGEQYLVGEVQADLPIYPLFETNAAQHGGKPELKAYAFESADFSLVRGYSGKTIDLLIVMDVAGTFQSVKVVSQHEPIFIRSEKAAALAAFAAQHQGLTVRHAIQIGKPTDTPTRNGQSALLNGLHTGTITSKAISRTVMVAAASVARERLGIDSPELGEGRVSLGSTRSSPLSEPEAATATPAGTKATEPALPAPTGAKADTKLADPEASTYAPAASDAKSAMPAAAEPAEPAAPAAPAAAVVAKPTAAVTAAPARPAAEPEWMEQWRARRTEIHALLAGLALLAIALVAQKRFSANARRLRVLRTLYLIFTLAFIGWFAQGQLTIVNVTAAIESLVAGEDLSFLMNDPITVTLWLFTIATLFIWGRGTFCGWLCPFGALQELISLAANAIGIRQRRIRAALDAKLKWIKYFVLAVIVASLYLAPDFAGWAVEIEPFKTAISLYFIRSWPYVLWAAACLVLTVFVYRGYCRYICPLGAALATMSFVRRWPWIARRDACGAPCQTCRHRCEYQAIAPTGKVNYRECFQCLDCVSIYQDDQHCLPLIQQRKQARVIAIQRLKEES